GARSVFLNGGSGFASAARVSSTESHRPSLVTPMGTTSKRSRSAAAITCWAETTETSCSVERPPKMRPRRWRSGMPLLPEALAHEGDFVLEFDAERGPDPLLGQPHEGGDVGGRRAAQVHHEVAVLFRELGAADAVAAHAHGVEELPGERLPGQSGAGGRLPGGAGGRVLEEGAGVAAPGLRRQPLPVELAHAPSQLRWISLSQAELDADHRFAGHQAPREVAAAVDEVEVRRQELDVAVLAGNDRPLQDVGEAAAVGAGVVDHGAAEGAGDAAGPLQAGVAGEGEAPGDGGEATAGIGADAEAPAARSLRA